MSGITVPADQALLEKARQTAAELVDKTISDLDGSGPASVTVRAINGFASPVVVVPAPQAG